jgi:hypothetical protein
VFCSPNLPRSVEGLILLEAKPARALRFVDPLVLCPCRPRFQGLLPDHQVCASKCASDQTAGGTSVVTYWTMLGPTHRLPRAHIAPRDTILCDVSRRPIFRPIAPFAFECLAPPIWRHVPEHLDVKLSSPSHRNLKIIPTQAEW